MEPTPTAVQPQPTKQPISNYYPEIVIERNIKPNRLYAFPLFGFLFKIIILIPVFVELMFLGLALFVIVMLLNPFVVLVTGKYWKTAYDLALGVMRLGSKVSFYFYGITDKYPGFDITTTPYTYNLAYPESSNRLFAIPILGFIIRIVLLIPFSIVAQVISYASGIATFFTFAPVLFKGYYPETTHEINIDAVRLSQASNAYVYGISDKYPNFNISWNHKTMKIVLIVLGIIIFLANLATNFIPKPPANYPTITPPPAIESPQV
ncbi:MAG: DUF4389 domain-containing protein [Candidatus Daviesbacteria bacterium]|nr:DUF4389 domain-containing protein [Candidatus Daviesbacteria bacterium]